MLLVVLNILFIFIVYFDKMFLELGSFSWEFILVVFIKDLNRILLYVKVGNLKLYFV